VFDDEAQPSQLAVFDALGNFLNRVRLTGLPGPNDQAFIFDLSAVVGAVPEPASLSLLGAALLGLAALRLRHGTARVPIRPSAVVAGCDQALTIPNPAY
jgi:hypothetical protein